MARYALNEAQQQALQTGKHLVVRANAGSGKTSVLTMRYIWLVVEHAIPMERIVAITFTTKAAAEMRQRIRQTIDDMQSSENAAGILAFTADHDVVCERLRALQRNVGSGRISTFHAFASGIVRTYGAQLGVDPEARELDDRERAELLTSAVRSVIRTHTGDHSLLQLFDLLGIQPTEDVLVNLVSSGESLAAQLAWFQRAFTNPPPDAEYPLPSAVGEHLVRLGYNALHQLRAGGAFTTATARTNGNQLHESLERLASDLTNAAAARNVVSALTTMYTNAGTARKSLKCDPEPDPLPSTWKTLLQWAAASSVDADTTQRAVATALLGLADEARAVFEDEKRRLGVIDYDDMMQLSVRLLEEHPRFRASLFH